MLGGGLQDGNMSIKVKITSCFMFVLYFGHVETCWDQKTLTYLTLTYQNSTYQTEVNLHSEDKYKKISIFCQNTAWTWDKKLKLK